MKRITLFVVFMLSIFSIEVFAQQGLHAGLKGFLGATILVNKQDSDNPNYDYKPRMGGAFGATIGYHFSDNAGIESGIGYTVINTENEDPDINWEQQVAFITIPLHLHINSNPDNVALAYFYIGPEFNFRVNSEVSTEITMQNIKTRIEDIGNTDNYKSFVMGAGLGVGVAVNVTDFLQVYGGMQLGGTFTDIYTEEAKEDDNIIDWWSAHGLSLDPETRERGTTFSARAGGELGAKIIIGR